MTQEEFRAIFSGGHLGDKLDFKKRINKIADFLWKGMSVETISDNKTLDAEDNNKIFLVDTDGKTITLPATEEGLKFTFINAGSDGGVEITLSPNANDAIYGSVPASAGSSADATTADGLVSAASGTDDEDFINTKSSANKGDRVTLVADGDDGWYIADGVGVWASS